MTNPTARAGSGPRPGEGTRPGTDTLHHVTQHPGPAARPPSSRAGARAAVLRAAAVLSTVLSVGLVLGVVLAAPAAADVPAQGWPENPPVDVLGALLLIGGVSLAVILVVTVLTVGPALARGERITPGVSAFENQWIGGPRKTAGELAGPDGDGSEAGGAGARW